MHCDSTARTYLFLIVVESICTSLLQLRKMTALVDPECVSNIVYEVAAASELLDAESTTPPGPCQVIMITRIYEH